MKNPFARTPKEPLPPPAKLEDSGPKENESPEMFGARMTARLTAEKQRYDLWAKQEDIAMHFNDLTMRLRLQALAGIGAAVVAAGTVFSHEGEIQLTPVGWFLYALAAIWAGIFLLDRFYYQALLKGAVKAIRELEEASLDIRLSSRVEENVGRWGMAMRGVFYLIVFALLLQGARWSLQRKTLEVVSKKQMAAAAPGPTTIVNVTGLSSVDAGVASGPDAGR